MFEVELINLWTVQLDDAPVGRGRSFRIVRLEGRGGILRRSTVHCVGPRTRTATIADSSSFHPPLGGFRGCLGKLGDSEAIFDIATVPPNTPMEANIA